MGEPTWQEITAEAIRRKAQALKDGRGDIELKALILEITREGWTPPEPVDPDLIAVLEFLSKRHPGSNYYHGETGKTDALTQTCLAAYKAGRERERREPIIRSRLPFA